MAHALYQKPWDSHIVHEQDDGTTMLSIDRHLIHEVSSPQAIHGLREASRKAWRSDAHLAMPDYNVPTCDCRGSIADPVSRAKVDALIRNCADQGILYPFGPSTRILGKQRDHHRLFSRKQRNGSLSGNSRLYRIETTLGVSTSC